MAFPAFLMKQLYRCDSVVISSFVRTEYTKRRWGWLLGSIGYSITHRYTLHPFAHTRSQNLKSRIWKLGKANCIYHTERIKIKLMTIVISRMECLWPYSVAPIRRSISYYTDSIYKDYKDKLQNCSCNQFHYIGTYKQVEANSMTKNTGRNIGSEKWTKKHCGYVPSFFRCDYVQNIHVSSPWFTSPC